MTLPRRGLIGCVLVLVPVLAVLGLSLLLRKPSAASLPQVADWKQQLVALNSMSGYAPPVGARLIFTHAESAWDGTQERDWIFYVASVPPLGTAGNTASPSGFDAARLAEALERQMNARVGDPKEGWYWRLQRESEKAGQVDLQAVSTASGAFIHVQWLHVK
jgi:hypothetical protein